MRVHLLDSTSDARDGAQPSPLSLLLPLVVVLGLLFVGVFEALAHEHAELGVAAYGPHASAVVGVACGALVEHPVDAELEPGAGDPTQGAVVVVDGILNLEIVVSRGRV